MRFEAWINILAVGNCLATGWTPQQDLFGVGSSELRLMYSIVYQIPLAPASSLVSERYITIDGPIPSHTSAYFKV